MLLRTRRTPAGFIQPCLPSPAERPPTGPGWIHEIKHDGFRLMVRRDAAGVQLLTRNGLDWSARFPLILEAAGALQVRSFLLDGEAVACDGDGMPVFDRLRYRRQDGRVFLYAFDLLELNGQGSPPRADRDPQAPARDPAAGGPGGPTALRARRRRVPARLQDGSRGHRLEAARLALPLPISNENSLVLMGRSDLERRLQNRTGKDCEGYRYHRRIPRLVFACRSSDIKSALEESAASS
jgi:hypothetical protein